MHNTYSVAIFIGVVTGFLAPISFFNLGIYHPSLFFILPLGIPLMWVIGLRLALFLKQYISWIHQFAKYSIVGFLNAAIDFGSLNILSSMTGITSGFLVGGINIPGLILSFGNGYFWNRRWVFNAKGAFVDTIALFAIIVGVGVLINSGIVVFITTHISPPATMSPEVWLNIAKVAATVVNIFFNFVGFKYLVFKK